MGKKIFIMLLATAAAGIGVCGLLMNTKRAKMHRSLKRAGRIMYSVGAALCSLSLQTPIGRISGRP